MLAEAEAISETPRPWVHNRELDLDRCPPKTVADKGLRSEGFEVGHRLNLSRFGLDGREGGTYSVTLTNRSKKTVLIRDIYLSILDVRPSPNGTLVFQEGQSVVEEHAFFIEILNPAEGRIYPAWVPAEQPGRKLYRDYKNLYLQVGEPVKFTFQVSAPHSQQVDFDIMFKLDDGGWSGERFLKVRNSKDFSLTMMPANPLRIFTLATLSEGGTRNETVYARRNTIDEARSTMFEPYDFRSKLGTAPPPER